MEKQVARVKIESSGSEITGSGCTVPYDPGMPIKQEHPTTFSADIKFEIPDSFLDHQTENTPNIDQAVSVHPSSAAHSWIENPASQYTADANVCENTIVLPHRDGPPLVQVMSVAPQRRIHRSGDGLEPWCRVPFSNRENDVRENCESVDTRCAVAEHGGPLNMLEDIHMPRQLDAGKLDKCEEPEVKQEEAVPEIIDLIDSPDRSPPAELKFPGCPVCEGKCRLEDKNVSGYNIRELKDHIFSTHFPWYLAIESQLKQQRSHPNPTALSQKLHPALCTILHIDQVQKLPEVFQYLWGKLIHDFLHFLYTRLGFKTIHQLLDLVRTYKLHPTREMMAMSTGASILLEEPEWVKAHKKFYAGSRNARIDFFSVTEPPALLHWITLTNILCQLSDKHRIEAVEFERRDVRDLYKASPTVRDIKPLACYETFWQAVAINDINTALSMVSMKQGVLGQHHPVNKCGPLNMCIVNGHYLMATALLFAGANVHECDEQGFSVFANAVHRRDVRGVKVLLPWVPKVNVERALVTAESENFVEIVAVVMEHLHVNRQPAAVLAAKIRDPRRTEAFENPADLLDNLKVHIPKVPTRNPPRAPPVQLSTPITASKPQTETTRQIVSPYIVLQEIPLDRVVQDSRRNCKCPVCQMPYSKMNDLKEHVCRTHLPWYVAFGENIIGAPNQTRLSKQLVPAIREILANHDQPLPEHHPVSESLGKLLHKFIIRLTSLLNLDEVDDLMLYIRSWNLYDSQLDYKNISLDESFLIQCFRNFDKEFYEGEEEPINISPPNCVSAVFYWYTLAGLISKLSPENRDVLIKYEAFREATDILTVRSHRNTFTIDEVTEFHQGLATGDVMKVYNLTSWNPLLCEKRLDDKGGSTPLMYALSQRYIGIATVLLMFGATVDQKNKKGDTALKLAAKEGNLEAVRFLLVWEPKEQVKAAYSMAKLFGNSQIAELINQVFPNEVTKETDLATQASAQAAVSTQDQTSSSSTRKPAPLKKQAKKRKAETKRHFVPRSKSSKMLSQSKEKKLTSAAASSIKPDPDLPWCVLCKANIKSGKLSIHYLQKHLPWYIGYSSETHHLVKGPRETGLFKTINTTLYRCGDLPNFPLIQRLVGQLADEFLLFLAKHLNLNGLSELVNYVMINFGYARLTEARNASEPFDAATVSAHRAYTAQAGLGDSWTPVLFNHEVLVDVLSELPKGVRRDCLTYEQFKRPVLHKCAGYIEPLNSILELECWSERFFEATNAGLVDTLQGILDKHPSLVELTSPHVSRASALSDALYHRRHTCATVLYLYGADVDQANAFGWTPLHLAAKAGDVKSVRFLLDLGAQADIKTPSGDLAVGIASSRRGAGHAFIAKLLREKQKS